MRGGRRFTGLVAVALVAAGAGCSNDPTRAASTTSARSSSTSGARGSTTTSTTARRGAVDFRNTTLSVPVDGDEGGLGALDGVTLVDGTFSQDGADDRLFVEVRDVLWADLDGDGTDEAVVSIAFDTGGTGRFTDVLVYRVTGSTARFVTHDGVGDRADGGIDRVSVADDELHLRRFTEGQGACCPTVIEERVLGLSRDALVARGPSSSWGVVDVTPQTDSPAPITVRFRPGTNRATLRGDVSAGSTLRLDAAAGQHLVLAVDAADAPSAAVRVELHGPGGARLATASSGGTIDLRLPTAGGFTLVASANATPTDDQGAWLSADLRIDS